MKRINLCLLAVLLSPMMALVGCPAADSSKAPVSSNETDKQKSPTATSNDQQKTGDHKGEDKVPSASKKGVDDKLPEIFVDWPKPKLAIVISASQDGYIEPCGCIGLENQKGGYSRRATFLKELRDKGWPLVLVDGGGLVRRYGAQAVLKYRAAVDIMTKLGYHAIGFGTSDLRLPTTDLLVDVVEEKNPFVVANVALSGDFDDKLTPDFREVDVAGMKIGITAILGKEYQEELAGGDIAFQDPVVALTRVVREMKKAKCDKLILLSHATIEESQELAKKFADFDVIVTAGGAVEPPTAPDRIEGKQQLMIDVGHKGSYVGVLGLFDDPKSPGATNACRSTIGSRTRPKASR